MTYAYWVSIPPALAALLAVVMAGNVLLCYRHYAPARDLDMPGFAATFAALGIGNAYLCGVMLWRVFA